MTSIKVTFDSTMLHTQPVARKLAMGSGPKCRRCGKPVSYGNIYCKTCGGTGIRLPCFRRNEVSQETQHK